MSHYPPVGVFREKDGSWICRVWAPEKERVEIILLEEKDRRVLTLEEEELGYWSATLGDLLPGTRYLFRLDGKDEFPDPASLSQPEGVHGPSEVVDRTFDWTDEDWKGMARGDMIIYELHTGTFSSRGDFRGVIDRLDYLAELGINSIELMPVAQFPGTRNWGYDGVFPFAVQNSYGGLAGLKALVDAAHSRGIAVLLDVVFNHTGPEGSYLNAFAPYFIDKYKSPWGPVVNLDGPLSYGARGYFLQNALLWLDECRIDGLRLDAVHAMYDSSALHFMQELKEAVQEVEERTGGRKLLIAELDLNDPRYISPIERGGYGLGAQWVDEFHHALHAVLTGETSGYYSDFGKISQLQKSFLDTYVYTGQYSKHRKRYFGVPVKNDLDQFVVFSQNHDHTGNRMMGERLSALVSFEALKLAAGAVLLSPYIPLLFMGEEYGEKNPFLYFISHESEELVEAVRKGRKEEFSYFNWENEPPDPFATETFRRSAPCWNCEVDHHAVLLSFYKTLIRLRKRLPCLRAPARDSLYVYPSPGENLVAFERKLGEEQVLVVMNFGREMAEFTTDRFGGKKMLDSSDAEWMGEGKTSVNETPHGLSMQIVPLSILAFQK